jgi:hypothetical protein
MGKSPLANTLLEFFGTPGSLSLKEVAGFRLDGLQECDSIKVDDVGPTADLEAVRDLLAPDWRSVNRKYRRKLRENFSDRPTVMCSNLSLGQLTVGDGTLREALEKRFPFGEELANLPGEETGWEYKALRAEVGEWMVYALYLASWTPEQWARRRALGHRNWHAGDAVWESTLNSVAGLLGPRDGLDPGEEGAQRSRTEGRELHRKELLWDEGLVKQRRKGKKLRSRKPEEDSSRYELGEVGEGLWGS